jgi:hypothetical protein
VRIPGGCFGVPVTQELADDRQPKTSTGANAGVGMTQVVDADPF